MAAARLAIILGLFFSHSVLHARPCKQPSPRAEAHGCVSPRMTVQSSYPSTQTATQTATVSGGGHPSLVINEMLYRADLQAGAPRFAELWNIGTDTLHLDGWRIGRRIGNAVTLSETFTGHLILPPGEKMVLSEPGLSNLPAEALHLELHNFPALSRLGDRFWVRNQHGELMDSVAWEPHWGANSDGISLERIDPLGHSLDPSNWQEHPSGHSAGRQNHHYNADPGPVRAVYALWKDSRSLVVQFSRFVDAEKLSNLYLRGEPLRRMESSSREGSANAASRFTFETPHPVARSHEELDLYDIHDTAGRPSPAQRIPLSYAPLPGELVFNEILFHPRSGRVHDADQGEYVEFINRSQVPLHLGGLHVHDRPDYHGHARRIHPEGLHKSVLPPGELVVFYADTSQTFEKTRIAASFGIPVERAHRFFGARRLTLNLPSTEGQVYLANASGEIIDSLWYHSQWHHPSLPDLRGTSLERISPEGASADAGLWTSSVDLQGGTPGEHNSVRLTLRSTPERHHLLSLMPNPFTHRHTGHSDPLQIHIELDEPGYLFSLRIFDRNGRLVRTLAQDHIYRPGVRLLWDGYTAHGARCLPGLYIVLLQARNPLDGSIKSDRQVVVLAPGTN